MPSEQEAGKEVEVVVLGSWVEVVRQKLEFAKQAKERMAVELLSVLCPIGMPPSATSSRTSFFSSSPPLTCGERALSMLSETVVAFFDPP